MAQVPYWTDPTIGNSLWDSFFLGGVDWPGVWEVTVKKSRQIEKAKQSKVDGYTTTDKGYNGAEVKAKGRIFRQDDFETLQEILPNFDPKKPGGVRAPVDIYTPITALFGVDVVYIEDISVNHPSGGVITIDISMSEWFPNTKPTSATKKPKGFDGADKAGAALNPDDFKVTAPSQGAPNL